MALMRSRLDRAAASSVAKPLRCPLRERRPLLVLVHLLDRLQRQPCVGARGKRKKSALAAAGMCSLLWLGSAKMPGASPSGRRHGSSPFPQRVCPPSSRSPCRACSSWAARRRHTRRARPRRPCHSRREGSSAALSRSWRAFRWCCGRALEHARLGVAATRAGAAAGETARSSLRQYLLGISRYPGVPYPAVNRN